jgi:hypothetical protein
MIKPDWYQVPPFYRPHGIAQVLTLLHVRETIRPCALSDASNPTLREGVSWAKEKRTDVHGTAAMVLVS